MIDFHSQLAIIPQVYETAELQDNLEHSGGISISWKSATDVEIPMGSYVTYNGLRYLLMQPYAPSKESAIHYKYDPQFKHPQAMLDFKPFWIKSKDADNKDIYLRTTSYTGFPYVIAQKLCDFFAEYVAVMHDTYFAETVGTDWTYHISAAVDEHGREINQYTIITVAFDGCSIKSAADSIAEAMGCNVFFDWSTKTIRFVAGTTIAGETYNCFHVLGGTTNMGKNTASGSFAAITQRLTLRTEADDEHTHEGVDYFPGSIIKTGAALEQGGLMLIKDLILDDIYPKMELYVCYTHQRLCNLTDNDTGEFIVDHWEKDGQVVPAETPGAEPVLKHFAKWYVRLSLDPEGLVPYKFDQSKLINDKPLSMLFQMDYRDPEHMSKLVGREFELTYFPSAVKEWDKTDSVDYDEGYTTYTGADPSKISEFRIALVAEGETILPTTSIEVGGEQYGLIPQVGDKVTLVNMALTEEKSRAQDELLAAAQEIIGLMQTPAGEYSDTVIFGKTHYNSDPTKAVIEHVSIGEETIFERGVAEESRKHGPVVTNINHNLDTNVAEVTVGSWTRKTRSGGTADKLETVTVSANSSTEGGTPYSDGSIGLGGGYGGNSVETYEQTSLKPESMFVAGLSNTIDAMACDSNGKVKHNSSTLDGSTDVYTMITAWAGIKDVTASCIVSVLSLPPVQATQTAGVNLEIGIFVTDKNGDETEITATNLGYEMTDEKRWLRLNFPAGYDMSLLQDALTQMFYIEHPAYTEREVGIVIQAMREGTSGAPGSFKSRAFTRTNVDISSVTPTGGAYNNPLPGDSETHVEYYTIGGVRVEVHWYDGIPQGDSKLWSTVCTFSGDNTSSGWSAPSQETDTDTLDIEFSPNPTQPLPPAGDTPPKTTGIKIPGDDTHGSRANGSGESADWYDTTKDSYIGQTPIQWGAMIWRAERKIKNGAYDGDWAITRIKGEKGDPGNNGGNTANVYLYKRSSTAITQTGIDTNLTLYYKFEKDANGKHLFTDSDCTTPFTDQTQGGNGWSPTIPAGTDPVYITMAVAYSAASYDNIGGNEWVTPALLGNNGINSASVFLYQRYAPTTQAPLPAKPTETLYYKFADGKLYTTSALTTEATTQLKGWSLSIPATNGNPCFVIQAAALSSEDYDAIEVDSTITPAKDDWSDVRKLVEDGAKGLDGYNTATLFLYSRTNTTKDWSNTLTYTFSTKSLDSEPAGWTLNQIPSGTAPVYVTAATAFSRTDTDTIEVSEWSTPVLFTENGADGQPGSAGADGLNSAPVFIYKRAASKPSDTAGSRDVPDDGAVYTFATGVLAPPTAGSLNGWTTIMPSNTGDNHYPCWVRHATAANTTATDAIGSDEWSEVTKLVEDGKNAIVLDLDNEHEDFIYDDAGINKTGIVTSQARLHSGSEVIAASDVMWGVSVDGGVHYVEAKSVQDGTEAKANITADGLLRVHQIYKSPAKVYMRAHYPENSENFYYAVFTGNKTSQDKYDLNLNPNSIAYNSATYTTQAITIGGTRTDLNGNKSTLAFDNGATDISTLDNSGKIRLFVSYIKTIGGTAVIERVKSASFSVTSGTTGIAALNGSIYFELRRYEDAETLDSSTTGYAVCDYETIPINKAVDGEDGKYTVTQYALSSSRTTHPSESSSDWSESEPTPTEQAPYVWQRTCVFNPNTSSYEGSWVYVCLTGEDGETGPQGPKGDKGDKGNKGDKGDTGNNGLQGCVVRVSEYKSTQVYRNDEGVSGLSVGYIDVVGVADSSTYGYTFYRYINSTPSSGHQPPNSTYWELLQDVGPIFTSLLIAKNAYIKFGTGNQFVITDAQGNVKAGMKGTDENPVSSHGGIRFWAGSDPNGSPSISVDDSPFRVFNDGHVVMTSADVKGTIHATDGDITGNLDVTGNGKLTVGTHHKIEISPDGSTWGAKIVGKTSTTQYLSLGFAFANNTYTPELILGTPSSEQRIQITDEKIEHHIYVSSTEGYTINQQHFGSGSTSRGEIKITTGSYSAEFGIDKSGLAFISSTQWPNADSASVSGLTTGKVYAISIDKLAHIIEDPQWDKRNNWAALIIRRT